MPIQYCFKYATVRVGTGTGTEQKISIPKFCTKFCTFKKRRQNRNTCKKNPQIIMIFGNDNDRLSSARQKNYFVKNKSTAK